MEVVTKHIWLLLIREQMSANSSLVIFHEESIYRQGKRTAENDKVLSKRRKLQGCIL